MVRPDRGDFAHADRSLLPADWGGDLGAIQTPISRSNRSERPTACAKSPPDAVPVSSPSHGDFAHPTAVACALSVQSVFENNPAAGDHIDALSLTAQDRQIFKRVAVDEQEVRECAGLEYA